MPISGVLFLHDHACLHTAGCIQVLLEHFTWGLFDHPPYSPDLALSNCHLFTYLKNCLGSQRFNDSELMEGIKMWLSSQVADFFDTGIQKLIPQYNKCHNSGDDYI
jgi:histone-lysine N-methyltransferase SETMAR